jgi:hypothetical protein
VDERKNGIVQEMAIAMLNQTKFSDIFWRDAVYIDFYILNREEI